jgi:hypothetical protein
MWKYQVRQRVGNADLSLGMALLDLDANCPVAIAFNFSMFGLSLFRRMPCLWLCRRRL